MRIACLLANGFEDSEFRVPYDQFRLVGHHVTLIGSKEDAELTGMHGREQVTVEQPIAEAQADDFDALFIPGGHSPDRLRADERMVRFARAFANKPVLAICHGAQLLLTAGMVKGRTMTAWSTVQKDLSYAGAQVVDRDVVVDGAWVTSRKPEDLQAFVRESLKLLREAEPATPLPPQA